MTEPKVDAPTCRLCGYTPPDYPNPLTVARVNFCASCDDYPMACEHNVFNEVHGWPEQLNEHFRKCHPVQFAEMQRLIYEKIGPFAATLHPLSQDGQHRGTGAD